MKMILAILISLLISQATYANNCTQALLKSLSIERVAELETFGPKGYKSHLPKLNAEVEAKASQQGMMWWDQRVYFVSSKEEALKHHQMTTNTWDQETNEDPLMFAAYVIVDSKAQQNLKENLAASEKLATQVKEAGFTLYSTIKEQKKTQEADSLLLARAHDNYNNLQKLLKESRAKEKEAISNIKTSDLLEKSSVIIKDYITQEWVRLPQNFLDRFTHPKIDFDTDSEGVFLRQVGWVKPTHKGVIVFSEMKTSTVPGRPSKSRRINKTKSFARKLKKSGYTITFNDNIEEVILSAKNQKRKGQSDDSGARFTDELISTYVENLKAGKAYSVELRSPDGELVSGTFGKIKDDGTVYGESVSYPDQNGGIDYAKVIVYHLIHLLNESGHTFMDAGMVTPFTRSGFYGQYITVDEFNAKYKGKNPKKPLNFNFDWEPESYTLEGMF